MMARKCVTLILFHSNSRLLCTLAEGTGFRVAVQSDVLGKPSMLGSRLQLLAALLQASLRAILQRVSEVSTAITTRITGSCAQLLSRPSLGMPMALLCKHKFSY